VRHLCERAWYFLCMGAGALLRSSRYARVADAGDGALRRVRKRRLFFAPLLVRLGDPLMRVLNTGVRVLPQRAWESRERALYHELYGKPIEIENDGTLVLPFLEGETLAALLEDPAVLRETRMRVVSLAARALSGLHATGVTHGDAMAENVMVSCRDGIARWFDFETVHDAPRPFTWRCADDVRALLATSVLRHTGDADDIVRAVFDGYEKCDVRRMVAASFGSVWRRPLPFHLGQAPLSLPDYKRIASLVRRSVRGAATALAFGALLSACEPDAYEVQRNLSYDPSTGLHGEFDFYQPRPDSGLSQSSRTDRPAILAIHGGAWKSGDKAWGRQIAKEFCPSGYVVFAINYRLSTQPGGAWPAQIDDVQRGLRYIRAHAREFGIDPARIASLGVSAGGHLATMVALRDDPASPGARITTAVNLDGEHDLTMPPDQVMADFDNIMTRVMGHAAPWSDAELRDISTVTFARPDVSVLTVHGAGDDNVYVMQGDRIHDALRAKGAETELIRLEGSEGKCHAACWRNPHARSAIHRFLDRRLQLPPR
jgi:acetyl esterase/lipase